MASTTFSSGTIVESAWLNDVNTMAYKSFRNIKDAAYGVTGDGVTDDTNAIIAAVAGIAAQGGGTLLFPTGVYLISAQITVPANVVLQGSGPRATFIKVASAFTGNAIYLSGDSASVSRMGFTSVTPRTAGAYIYIAGGRANVVEDFWMATPFIGIHVGSCVITHINRGEIYDMTPTTGIGIKVNGQGNDTYISNILVQGTQASQPAAAYSLEDTQAVTMYNCGGIYSGTPLWIHPGTGEVISWLFIHSCALDSSSGHAISITPTGTGTVRGVVFVDGWGATCLRGLYVEEVGGASLVDGVDFIGGRLINNQTNGAYFVSGANINVRDSIITGNSTASIGTHPGIACFTGLSNFNFTNNTIGAAYAFGVNQPYGITVATGSDGYTITGNYLLGNVTSGLSDASSATAVSRIVTHNLGYTNYAEGLVSTTTDGSGDVTVTHGMSGTPTRVLATLNSTAYRTVQAHTKGATTFKLRFFDAAGAALLTTAVDAAWVASFN